MIRYLLIEASWAHNTRYLVDCNAYIVRKECTYKEGILIICSTNYLSVSYSLNKQLLDSVITLSQTKVECLAHVVNLSRVKNDQISY